MTKKRRLKFGIRTLIVITAMVAMTVAFRQRGKTQRRNVETLEEYVHYFSDPYGDQLPEQLLSRATFIDVVYRDEVTWDDREQRFVRDLPYGENQFYKSVSDLIGRDLLTTPVAVLISCNDFDRESGEIVSTFDKSLLSKLGTLPTVKQLWVVKCKIDGKCVNAFSNSDLREHFPDMIFAPTDIPEQIIASDNKMIHPKPDLRVLFNIKDHTSGSVIMDVIRLGIA